MNIPEHIFPVLGTSFTPDQYFQLDLSFLNPRLSEINLPEYLKETIPYGKIGYGGYLENRTFYLASKLFSNSHRTLHLGIDLWAAAGTTIYCPLDARVHSFADNRNYLDYGPTIILEHQIGKNTFYTLYGHLSRESLQSLTRGMSFKKGSKLATLGTNSENGNWPPHLHLQGINHVGANYGDFPGVVELQEGHRYSAICPNPLQLIGLS